MFDSGKFAESQISPKQKEIVQEIISLNGLGDGDVGLPKWEPFDVIYYDGDPGKLKLPKGFRIENGGILTNKQSPRDGWWDFRIQPFPNSQR